MEIDIEIESPQNLRPDQVPRDWQEEDDEETLDGAWFTPKGAPIPER